MEEIDKLRKKIKKEVEDIIEVDEDSDIPIREKQVKEKKFKEIK
jgi:hypothetical protein